MSTCDTPAVKISLTAPGRGSVLINGIEVPGIQRLVVEAEGHRHTRVALELIADVELTAEQASVVFINMPAPEREPTPT